jgi:hypothetical protein
VPSRGYAPFRANVELVCSCAGGDGASASIWGFVVVAHYKSLSDTGIPVVVPGVGRRERCRVLGKRRAPAAWIALHIDGRSFGVASPVVPSRPHPTHALRRSGDAAGP